MSILYRFRVTESYLSKVADFNLPHLHFAPNWGWPHSNVLATEKTRVPELSCDIVCVTISLAVLSDTSMSQTHTQDTKTTYRASIALHVKNVWHYYAHQLILNPKLYSWSMTLTFNPRWAKKSSEDSRFKGQRKQTDRWTYVIGCFTFPANLVGNECD